MSARFYRNQRNRAVIDRPYSKDFAFFSHYLDRLHEGEINLFSPSVRGRAAEGGRGSVTRHFELGSLQSVSRDRDFIRHEAEPFNTCTLCCIDEASHVAEQQLVVTFDEYGSITTCFENILQFFDQM